MAKRLDFLKPYVKEIVDHRPLDKQQWNYSNDVKTLIKIVGSCATLIVQRIQSVAKGIEFFNTYPVCADLLHSKLFKIKLIRAMKKYGSESRKRLINFLYQGQVIS